MSMNENEVDLYGKQLKASAIRRRRQRTKVALQFVRTGKVGRNENCPCRSGRKFKHCHGKPSEDKPRPKPAAEAFNDARAMMTPVGPVRSPEFGAE